MRQMREVNERLVVAAVRAHDLSDEAQMQAAQAQAQLDDLMSQLRAANRRLAVVAEHAHRMAAEAIEREEEYRRLSARLLTLQDEERRRLALDLHDSTSQQLAALIANLDVVGRATEALDGGARRALAESRSLAEQCAREVRTFAYLLHPLLDEMGLLSAVRWYWRASRSAAAFMWSWIWTRSDDCHGRSRRPSSASCRKVSRTSIVMRQPQPPRFVSRPRPTWSRSKSTIRDTGFVTR